MSSNTDILRDFDTWSEVARSDPRSFEAMRRAVIDEFIDSAPEANQERLRRLQWRIDQERRRAVTPIGACLRIYRMMWDSVIGPGGLRDRITDLSELMQHGKVQERVENSADVLEFRAPVCNEA